MSILEKGKAAGIVRQTPAQVAAFIYRLTGGNPRPEITAANFRANAATMRKYADKARASKTGKYRGYTVADAEWLAADLDARAVSVPEELHKLISQRDAR